MPDAASRAMRTSVMSGSFFLFFTYHGGKRP
jgi:hypothetical protein